MKISDVLIQLIGARDPDCPSEADVLAYSENKLSPRNRAQLERHFVDCYDCRELLALLGRESEEAPDQVAEEAVAAQTARVLGYIRTDELAHGKPATKRRAAAGFSISYPRLASVGLVVCAIAVAGVFLMTRDQAPADAMEALKLAVKDARYSQARVSGGLDYSRFAGTRRGPGDPNDRDFQFDRALGKLRTAEQDNAPVKRRLVLARIHLARGTREDAKSALAILNQLAARGVDTAEALNDTGVAQFQLDNYDEAIGYFSKALQKSPAYYEALFNRALAEERAHRDDDARRDWQQFIEHSPDESWKAEAREHLNSLGG